MVGRKEFEGRIMKAVGNEGKAKKVREFLEKECV